MINKIKLFIILVFILCRIDLSYGAHCTRPFGLQHTNVTGSSAELRWDASTTADSFMIRYNEFNSTDYSWKTISGGGGIHTYVLTGLLPGVKYSWVVRSHCQLFPNVGYPLVPDTFTTTATIVNCVKPFNLSATSITNNSAVINWSAFVVADTFRLRYSENGSSNYFYKDLNGSGGLHSASLSNLNIATTYQVQISSICSGVSSGYCNSFIFTTTAIPIVCGRPFNLGVTNVTNFSALVSWTPYVTADTFRIRYSVNGTTDYFYKDINGSSNPTTTLLANLIQNTTYQFRVSSLCSGVSSGYSSSYTFTTTNLPVPCIIPYDVSSAGITGTTAFVTWSPLVTADSFMVRYSANGTTNYLWKKVSGEWGVSSAQLTGLSLNTQYQFQVRSICAGITTSIYSAQGVFVTGNFRLDEDDLTGNDLDVFPVPATDKINVRFNSGNSSRGKLHLKDLAGHTIHSSEFSINEGENNLEIFSQNFSSGIYFLILETEKSKNIRRVVIE